MIDADEITPEDAERRQAATDHWREAEVDSLACSMSQRNARSLPMNPPDTLTPKYNIAATHLAKKKLVSIMGQESYSAFVAANGGFQLANLAKILPPELLRLGAGGLPAAAATTAPAKQFIRLGHGTPAAAPSKPTTAPRPSTPSKVHEFVPAKPTTPQGKSGARSGALSIGEAEALALKVFPNCTTAMNTTEAARWKSLESVFKANGHSAPWRDDKSIGIPSDKLAGHAARAAKISAVFETGLTRSEFGRMSARDQSNFCKNGGKLRD